jgi:hypothetical protein
MPCACEKKGKKASKQTQHVCSAKEEEEEEEEEVHICLILSAYFLHKTDFYSNYGSLER